MMTKEAVVKKLMMMGEDAMMMKLCSVIAVGVIERNYSGQQM